MTRVFLSFVGFLLLSSCAQITPLEGGDKDILPPKVDTLHSSPMAATNYHPKSIKLSFNEWVKLNNVFKNVLVSPPLAKRPKVTMKRKTVVFEFDKDEVLKDNTTYSINFGSAIVDLTEANAATGLTYVFSTGDEIDSLSVQGQVVDAYTNKPMENVSVMLYSELSDSIVYKEKPYYLGITNKEGLFQINNVRAGEFKAFALKDGNFDYLFSQPDEPIGFLPELVTVGDSTQKLKFRLAPERLPIKLKGTKHLSNGIKLLEFNRIPQEPTFQLINVDEFHYFEKGDSIKIWYLGVDTTSELIILSENKVVDTISLRPKSRLLSFKTMALQGLKKTNNLTAHPEKPVQIEFNIPIKSWNDSLIIFLKDTLAGKLNPNIQINPKNPKLLDILFPWHEKSTYLLTIFPKGITGVNEELLVDTLTRKISITPKEKLGNILLKINLPDSTMQYVVRLLLKGKEIENNILPQGSQKIEWNLLPPGDYSLELIEDTYPNGLWDPGNYLQSQQPERVFVRTLEQLRANWDLEVDWTPNEEAPSPEKKSSDETKS